MIISRAAAADLGPIKDLVESSGLPLDGIEDHLDGFVVARVGDELVACAAVERYGPFGLLRSVAVNPDSRGNGLGREIVSAAISDSQGRGVKEMVLLTTTARDFFVKHFAFEDADRGAYDKLLAKSPEWTLPRCSTAVVMRKRLR